MRTTVLSILLLASGVALGAAQDANFTVPNKIEAGSAFTIHTTGSGKATLTIVGPGQVIQQQVQLGEGTSFAAGSLYNAGRYVAVLSGDAGTETQAFDVVPASKPANLSFLAKPSRLPVGLHGGITGTVYVFDVYDNLIVMPARAEFELSNPAGTPTSRTVETQNGAATVEMDSSPREGKDVFTARVGDISAMRVIRQVPGDPCSLKLNAKEAPGERIELETDPVRDCSGNAIPDGTIVTFTEAYEGGRSTVDVPLKQGIAKVEMPARRGSTISVASGVVLGNQIRWEK